MLTIEELKNLPDGEYFWLVEIGGMYVRKVGHTEESMVVDSMPIFCEFNFSDYGTKWLAYKNKELAEVNENNLPLDVEVQALHMTCFFKEAYIKQLQKELEATRKSKKEAEEKSITLPYLLCTSNKFACVIWRDSDGKVKKTYTMPIGEAKGVLKDKESLCNTNE